MIYPGMCSLTLGRLSPDEVIAQVTQAGLTHIEWWGKDHVPPGDVAVATEIGEKTRQAGLTVSTYGSYYRVGAGEGFDDVLQAARALEAPAIRVWAGVRGSGDCPAQQRRAIVDDTLRIADLCAAVGLELVFEYHGGTLTDTHESAVAFAASVQHPAVRFGWQPRTGASVSENQEGLRGMLSRLTTLHVFNWKLEESGAYSRHPLSEARDEWKGYFETVTETGRDHVALLEFAKDNSVEQFQDDARVLLELTRR